MILSVLIDEISENVTEFLSNKTANYTELTKHYKTVINRPVKWIKQVKFGDNENYDSTNYRNGDLNGLITKIV